MSDDGLFDAAWGGDVRRWLEWKLDLPNPSDTLRLLRQDALDRVHYGSAVFCSHLASDNPPRSMWIVAHAGRVACAACLAETIRALDDHEIPCASCGALTDRFAEALIGLRLWIAVPLCLACVLREDAD